MQKYDALRPFFESLSGPRVELTFQQIEDVLGFKLPNSAYKHNAWWGNSRTKSHWWSHHWMRAGWKRATLDFARNTVVFERQGIEKVELSAKVRNYWWVNHKQTHREEINGGYIWSPRSKANGGTSRTYENLREASPGDLVFSYASGQIKAVGVVSDFFRDAGKPAEFGTTGDVWGADGWLVPVDWTLLVDPISPKDHLDLIAPLLPTRHSPIRASTGDGNQGCYLAEISVDLGNLLLGIVGRQSAEILDIAAEKCANVQAENEQSFIEKSSISETYKEQLIKARRGQGQFRVNVLSIEKGCRLTGVIDRQFLIASHIKPWAEADNSERLDGNNGLLLAPHADKLFDRGHISFEDDGVLLVATPDAQAVVEAWALAANYVAIPFSAAQRAYLAFHREFVFQPKIAN